MYPRHTATEAGRRRNLWGSNGQVSPDETTSSSEEEVQEIGPASSTSWVIPSTIDEASPPPKIGAGGPVDTPATAASTPSMSNVKSRNNGTNSGTKRSLHTSHRKRLLHRITPKAIVETNTNAHGISFHNRVEQHRGNGVVLDLTSLFSADEDAKSSVPYSPAETATTAASTLHNNNNSNNHLFGATANAYSSPSSPPWKTQTTAAVASPVAVQDERHAQNAHLRDTSSRAEDPCFQWDTKSQTTQEALLTERQCQALTQWINFALVGEQSGDEDHASPSPASKKKYTASGKLIRDRSFDGSFDNDDDNETSINNNKKNNNRSRATTPIQGRCSTPLTKASSWEGTHISRGPRTPVTIATRIATTTSAKRRPHSRMSMFQYSQSYDCAHAQAHHWFQKSAQWKELRLKIRCEISTGKLTLREDRDLYANLAVREKVLNVFLSYRPAWLTLALEVVMNETLSPAHGLTLPSQTQLKQFIVSRVLSDDKLLSKYTQGRGSRVPSGKFDELYHAELRPLVLYRLLVLVFFLDRAAGRYTQNSLGNLFQSNPDGNTFKSKGKSTAQVLVTMCREFLSRQGDVIKQLARVNLHVYYKQDRLDEIDFPIQNFAIDLRDGARLSRLVELLWLLPRNSAQINATTKYPLLSQLRSPAISRLQKIHNVNVALAALQDDCLIVLPQDLQAHHIVDGQRRMVLRLVWTMVLMHCFEDHALLNQQQLEGEIASIQGLRKLCQSTREKQQQRKQESNTLQLLEQETEGLESVTMVTSFDGSKASRKLSKGAMGKWQRKINKLSTTPVRSHSRSSSFDGDDVFSCHSNTHLEDLGVVQQWKGLLMQWCEQVCILVEEQERAASTNADASTAAGDWTSTDLMNGKALCCLIHYYHPLLLPREELRLAITTMVDGPPTRIQTTQTMPLQRRNKFRQTQHQRLKPKTGPDYHIRLAHQRLSELGGIPPMMLIPLSTARKHRHGQRNVSPLADEKSALVYLYHICARLLESRHQVQAVVYVQQRYRYLSWLSWLKRKRQASKVIWQCWQENKDNYFRARSEKYKHAVQVIEAFSIRYFDNLLHLQEKRLERNLKNLAAAPLQARARGFLAKQQYHVLLERHYAAIIIQSQYRQFRDHLSYQEVLLEVIPALTVVQRHWRGYVQRRAYVSAIDATIEVQAFVRGAVLVRTSLLGSWHNSSTCIQRIWRGFRVQFHYQMDLLDIVAVQCLARKQQAIHLAKLRSGAVQVLQCNARASLARFLCARLRTERKAAIVIQKMSRRHLAVREAAKWRAKIALAHAIFVVQKSWRRTLFIRERVAASSTIQTQYRLWAARQVYLATCAATIKVQSQWRRYAQRKKYLQLLRKVILLQSCLRRWHYGVVCVLRRQTALKILQNRARRWLALRVLEAMREHRVLVIQNTIICQAFARRKASSRRWRNVRYSVLAIQENWRLYRWMRCTKRKWQLISALPTCALLFRRSQKGAFKIVPHTRRVASLNKQALARCGHKQIALSNAATWAIPYRGHRQVLFRHRSHVKTVRQKYNSGVRLEDLGPRRIRLRTLRNISQAAVQLQEPWQYPHFNPIRRDGEVTIPKERVASRYDARRVSRAQNKLVIGCKSLLKRSANSSSATPTLSYQGAVHRITAMSATLVSTRTCLGQRRQHVHVSRVLNLVHRHIDLPSNQKRADHSLPGPPSLNPWKTRALRNFAATKIQKNCRVFVVETRALRNSAATKIQKAWRRFVAGKQFHRDLRRVIIIQSVTRKLVAQRSAADIVAAIADRRKARQKVSALTIQRHWRGHLAVLRLNTFIRSIVALQSVSRSVLARKRLEMESSVASRIQQVTRCRLARLELSKLKSDRKIQQAAMFKYLQAATILQSTSRGHSVRGEMRQLRIRAVVIQRYVRGYKARVAYQVDAANVVKSQNAVRRWRALRLLLNLRAADTAKRNVIKAQNTVRRWRARKLLSDLQVADAVKQREMDEGAVLKIQSAWRGFSCRAEFMVTLLCAIRIQSWWRSILQRERYQRTLTHIINLQSAARGLVVAQCVSRRQSAAIVIESCTRAILSKSHLVHEQRAAATIQRHSRGFLARQQISLQHFAATEIQKTWRCNEAGAGYIGITVAAIKIQSFFRMAEAKKESWALLRLTHLRQDYAAKIQSLWRMWRAVKQKSELERMSNAVLKIQTKLRKNLALRHVVEIKRRQASFASIARKDESLPKIIKLQSVGRMFLASKQRTLVLEQKRLHVAATKIQSIGRVSIVTSQKRRFVRQQKTKQQKKAACNVESALERSTSTGSEGGLLHRRLSRSQGLVRGFLTRQQSKPEVRRSTILIKEAELRSKLDPSLRLGARMELALKLLQSSSSLTEIMNIVCTLEIATRFSKECCEEFVVGRAIEILVALAPTCNKSLPHVELLYYIMCTLSNVSKHELLVPDVATLDAATAFVHLIRMYGSEDAIFCSSVSLLEMCALQNPDVPAFIAAQKRLEGIYKSWERKLHHKKVIEPAPFRVVAKPQFLVKRSKAKTDMLILGISYDLDQGVSTLERLLHRAK